MALTGDQRERGWTWLSAHLAPGESVGKWTKPELRAAADAANAWVESTQASYVSALAGTVFAGAGSTTDQKVRLLIAVLVAQFDVEV